MAFYRGPNVVTNGLVLSLDAGNTKSYTSGSTTWYDKSGNGLNGTLTNGPTFSSANNGSIVFDGINDYVNISSSGYNLGVNFSLQVWTRITRFGGGPFNGSENRASLISNSYPYSANQGFLLMATSQGDAPSFIPTPGKETFFLSIGNDQYSVAAVSGSLTPFINNWVQLSAVINNTNPIRLYVNGVQPTYAYQQNGPASLSYSAGPFSIGVRNNNLEFLQGSIANTLIYNRALSNSEVQQNYNAQKSRFNL